MAIFLFSRDRMTQFKKVVLVEYPRKGIYTLGFLTNESGKRFNDRTRREMCNIFYFKLSVTVDGFYHPGAEKRNYFDRYEYRGSFQIHCFGRRCQPAGLNHPFGTWRKPIQLIIFDLDGTLVDAYQAVHLSVNYALDQLNYPPIDFETIRKSVGWGELAFLLRNLSNQMMLIKPFPFIDSITDML